MKVFLKKFSVYLAAAVILCSSLFLPVSAADIVDPTRINSDGFWYQGQLVTYSGGCSYIFMLPVGDYSIENQFDPAIIPGLGLSNFYAAYWYDTTNQCSVEIDLGSIDYFSVTESMISHNASVGYIDVCMVVVNSMGSAPSVAVYEPPAEPMSGAFWKAYDMFAEFLYGDVELTNDQTLVLTILATTAALFVVGVPFLIVYFFLRLSFGG